MLLVIILIVVALVLALCAWALRVFVKKVLHDDIGRQARLLVGLLVIQFILGMLANLFQAIPKVEPWLVFHEVGPIVLHTANATALLILAIIFRVLAARSKRMEVPASVGGVGVGVAFVCGIVFVNHGQNNIYSFGMSLGFITALVSYSYAGFRTLAKA